ncbi:Integrase catalytic domain-containing protein [Mycena chlorophos]|uniref:Integrase catalytic domain-containing protein n=1 Tax=Mycena chlorophos TaxID=658473 RepID=A0A8H6WH32_MYCCL|nr:Integrase catalytic domain-containing protein [Mycena chlorophos]
MNHPPDFPPLPNIPGGWIQPIRQAHEEIQAAYARAAAVLQQNDPDPLRLRFHAHQLRHHIVALLDPLAVQVARDDWLLLAANAVGALIADLENAQRIASRRNKSQLHFFKPVQIQQTGWRGRPRKLIDRDWLADAVSAHRNISIRELARHLRMDPKTLRSRLRFHGLHQRFADLGDQELDVITRHFKRDKPSSGLRYLIGHLRQQGIKIQKERVRRSLLRVDGLGQALRRRRTIVHREYISPRPNAKWHMDGHHKLIRHGIVIHAFVDGYDRMCTGIRASNNNKSETVLEVFLQAVQTHGVPSRVRGDRGGENVLVSVWMIKHHGPGRGSFSWGLSTRNTPSERFWVEVGSQVVRAWRCFLSRLERLHKLDVDDPCHLWLIHHLFLDTINDELAKFAAEWNAHPMRGRGNISPEDARFLGRSAEGMYADDVQRIHPDVLRRYRNAEGMLIPSVHLTC